MQIQLNKFGLKRRTFEWGTVYSFMHDNVWYTLKDANGKLKNFEHIQPLQTIVGNIHVNEKGYKEFWLEGSEQTSEQTSEPTNNNNDLKDDSLMLKLIEIETKIDNIIDNLQDSAGTPF